MNVNDIVFGGDLVTVQKGTTYHTIHYYFTDSDKDVISTYRDSVGLEYIEPNVENFSHWQINDRKLSANQYDEYGLSADVSAYMYNTEICKFTYIDDSKKSVKVKTDELSIFRAVQELSDQVTYTNTYPSVVIDIPQSYISSGIDNTYRYAFKAWKINDVDVLPNELYEVIDTLSAKIKWTKQIKLYAYSNLAVGGSVFGTGYYDINSIATISAIPSANWHVKAWKFNIDNWHQIDISDEICDIQLSDKYTELCILFEKDRHTLTLNSCKSAYGKVGINGNVFDLSTTISSDFDQTKQISAYEIHPYKFVGWSDGNTLKVRNVVMTKDYDLTANFDIANVCKVYLFSNDETYGKVVQSGSGKYYAGDTLTIKAIPEENYQFVSWSDGDTNQMKTIRDIRTNMSLTAIFKDDFRIINEKGENVLIQTNSLGELSGITTLKYNI